MNRYEPSIEPDAEEWLGLAESERLDLVREYHESAKERISEEAMEAHAAAHVLIENQIAMALEPVPETVARLIHQGLERHEAIHAVAAVLLDEIGELQHNAEASWNQAQYRRKLEKLTAKRWRKGQW
jgi:hypothetical protein